MPALINVAANLAFGGAVAWALRRSSALRAELLAWPFLVLLVFEAVVFTPVATYMFRFYPQWSMLYWFDPQVFPGVEAWVGALSFVAIACNFAAAIGGYAAVREGVARGARWLVIAPFAAAALLVLWVFAAYGKRVAFIGDYDEFWQGQAKLVFAGVVGWLAVALYGGAAAFVLWVRSWFEEKGEPSVV